MKILILSDDFPPKSYGGAGIVAFMQAKELAKRGHDVAVITSVQEIVLEERVDYEGLVVHCVYTQYKSIFRSYISLYNPQTVFKIKKILTEFKPDIVHAHNVHQFLSYHSLLLAKKNSKKVCLTFHDAMPVSLGKLYPKTKANFSKEGIYSYKVSVLHQIWNYRLAWNPLRNILIKFYLKNVDVLLAVSSSLRSALNQNGIQNIEVLHNGINVENFVLNEHAVHAFKQKYNLTGKKILFFSGRISRAKGIDVCLQVIKKLSNTIPQIHLLIAGHMNSYLEDALSNNEFTELKTKITFTGWLSRSDVAAAYCCASVVPVLSVYLDPFPTTNLEAMAAKKPIIGTNLGGTSEIVLDGITGYIVNPGNIESVADRVSVLLLNDDLSESFGNAGYERVVSNFSLKMQIDSLLKYYEKC